MGLFHTYDAPQGTNVTRALVPGNGLGTDLALARALVCGARAAGPREGRKVGAKIAHLGRTVATADASPALGHRSSQLGSV